MYHVPHNDFILSIFQVSEYSIHNRTNFGSGCINSFEKSNTLHRKEAEVDDKKFIKSQQKEMEEVSHNRIITRNQRT